MNDTANIQETIGHNFKRDSMVDKEDKLENGLTATRVSNDNATFTPC